MGSGVTIDDPLDFRREELAVFAQDRLEFRKNFQASLNLFLITAESQFVSTNDDGNVESIADEPKVLVLAAEESANLFLVFEVQNRL